jgi:hypothetical protein
LASASPLALSLALASVLEIVLHEFTHFILLIVDFILDWTQFDETMAFSTSRFGVVRIVLNRATNRLLAVKTLNPRRF